MCALNFPVRQLLSCIAILTAIAVSGCSIYPIVQESTGKETYGIVRNIRCEARDAVISRFLGLVYSPLYKDKAVYNGRTGEQFIADLRKKDPEIWDINWNKIDKKLKENWRYYLRSSITYDFTLEIEEQNDQSLTLDFVAARWGQASKVPFGLQNTASRQVQRNFRVYDTWQDLFSNEKWSRFCEKIEEGHNYLYPAAGYLNLHDMFKQFVNLNQSNNLAGLANPDVIFADQVSNVSPTLSDTVEFTTKVQANVDPAVIVGQTIGRYTLTDFALKLDNFRRDHHKVIIVVSLPPDAGGFTTTRADLAARGVITNDQRILGAAETIRQRQNSGIDSLNRLGSAAGSIINR